MFSYNECRIAPRGPSLAAAPGLATAGAGVIACSPRRIFIRELLIDLGFSIDGASVINCDSKSAVGMAFDPIAFKKTKHILRAAEFLRHLVSRGVISVEHLPGVVMLAVIRHLGGEHNPLEKC